MEITSTALIPYLVSILVVFIFFLMHLSLMLFAGVGFDVDADADIDADIDLDIELDADLDVDADADVDIDTDVDSEFSLGKFLSPLGVGQIPLSIIGYAYALSFGVAGVISSYLLAQIFVANVWFLFITIPISIVAGWHATKHSIRLILPVLKTSGIAEGKTDLVGRQGRVTSLKATKTFGEAVFTINGAINHMIVKTDDEEIEKNSEVVVVGFDEESKRPIITRLKA
jgi:hypothetical protein